MLYNNIFYVKHLSNNIPCVIKCLLNNYVYSKIIISYNCMILIKSTAEH